MKKLMSPNSKIVWVDEDGVDDPDAPTVTEMNAGIDISAAIARGYTLNPTASDTDNSASIVDEGNVDNRGNTNYEASLTLFEEADNADSTSAYLIATGLFEVAGARGYLYRRIGKKAALPFIATDKVEGFFVESDNPQTVDGGDNGGPIQMTVPFLQQGHYVPRGTAVVTAG